MGRHNGLSGRLAGQPAVPDRPQPGPRPQGGKPEPSETPQAILVANLRTKVTAILAFHYGDYFAKERRSNRRFPFHLPVIITPVDDRTGRLQPGASFQGFGIDISSGGARFLARQLLSTQRAVLSCEGPGKSMVNLAFELRWARLTNDSWYDIGARFTDVLPESPAPAQPPSGEPPTSFPN